MNKVENVKWCMKQIDTSVGTVYGTYSVDLPKYRHGHIGVIQMMTLLCGVEI